MNINGKKLLISLGITVGTGLLSAVFTMGSMNVYDTLNKPALAPGAIVFPIVWSVLFILMGISLYLTWNADAPKEKKRAAVAAFGVQLAMNLAWSLIFFNARDFALAFAWIIGLWAAILITMALQHKVSRPAAYLMIPYILWVTFAAYLTYEIFILN